MTNTVIKNLFIIIVILILVFMSQQHQFRGYGQNLYNQTITYIQQCWQKAYNYFLENIYPKISGEVQKRQEIIQEELQQEKEKVSQTFWEKVKNYFTDIFNID